MARVPTQQVLDVLASAPVTVRQLVALDLHEAAERCQRRMESVDNELNLRGAADLLAQQEFLYRHLVRLLTDHE